MSSTLFQFDTEEKFCLNIGAPGPKALREATKIMKIAADHCLAEEIGKNGDVMQYGPPNGSSAYLRELATFLTEHYEDHVAIGDLVLTSGATVGLYTLLTQLFPTHKCPVFVEEVTYHIAISMIGGDLKFPLISVPMDDHGIDTNELEKIVKATELSESNQHNIRGVVYMVPNFQNPTGTCTSDERRAEIVEIARKYQLLVICDDVYDLLYYETKPPKRIFAFDHKTANGYHGNVVSNGTFAKILGPGLRLGWLEVPHWLKKVLESSGLISSGGSLNHFTSVIVAKALHLGLVSQHLINLRNEYRKSFAVAYNLLDSLMPDGVSYIKSTGGYFIWIKLPNSMLASDLLELCVRKYDLSFQDGSKFAVSKETKEKFASHIRISISYYEAAQLAEVLSKLCFAVREMLTH